jgi:hypothetical protein
MGYDYDIFLTYLRSNPLSLQWVNDIFYPLFEPLVSEAANAHVRIFKDTESIMSGMNWKNRIKQALAHSKIMVPVFSPLYFQSKWCLREFTAMYYRQCQLNLATINNPNGLILPVKIFDGQHFPQQAADIHTLDCTSYFRVGEAVKTSLIYLELQEKLIGWVDQVAAAIQAAPAWDAAWKSDAWLEDPYKNWAPIPPARFNAPKL